MKCPSDWKPRSLYSVGKTFKIISSLETIKSENVVSQTASVI
jgi:hypothetical protein